MTQEFRRDAEPVVWIVQEPWANNADLSSAQRYGKLRPILKKNENASVAPGPCLRVILQALNDYRPGDYFLAPPADPAAPLLLGIAIERLRLAVHEPIRWLRWERERDTSGERIRGAGFYAPSTLIG